MYEPKDVVKNWLRVRDTIEFLGLWETINNPNFKESNWTLLERTQVAIPLPYHLKNGLIQQMQKGYMWNSEEHSWHHLKNLMIVALKN
ncbi:hypothetical protein [Mesomycoplasma conjunctivae]|uniref:hypothetical protein n=1 Tax=Mesomycoplasma conjunctivae TaxID=45361 RepID=UPI003DA26EF8